MRVDWWPSEGSAEVLGSSVVGHWVLGRCALLGHQGWACVLPQHPSCVDQPSSAAAVDPSVPSCCLDAAVAEGAFVVEEASSSLPGAASVVLLPFAAFCAAASAVGALQSVAVVEAGTDREAFSGPA